ncbi:PQ-loop domain-containing transporter [Metamycoplasma hyosynoviae]|uniref:PQ-loop domain-containing transporter n=1 Tax=Metamycoplasma hyosynoviae TaxID=29559 RepID=UPI0023594352|nr:PQ-loop domain-containing transporter [Metamycoplasma hyosynoviae]MDC8917286.1 PQ-loop domain-containing transporter [Metamycoplasma hyosynoviae]
MNTTKEVLGVIGALITIGLGIPQLIEQLKTKETGKVNFASFWIFYIGILFWVVYGVFGGPALWQVFFANFFCMIIYSFTMFFLYYYYKQKTRKMMIGVISAISVFAMFTLAMLIVFGIMMYDAKIAKVPNEQNRIPILEPAHVSVISAIAPSLTTLAFLPQFIINLKQKNFQGITPWMPLLFLANNTIWVIYFMLTPFAAYAENPALSLQKEWTKVAPALAWQFISLTVYGMQFIAIIMYRCKCKKLAKLEGQKNQNLQSQPEQIINQ